MKNKLIINTNISQAINDIKSDAYECIYAPTVKTQHQSVFFKKRFQELKKLNKEMTYQPIKDIEKLQDANLYYIWDAQLELTNSSNLNIGKQNRLFDHFNLTQESFTPFKKATEPQLPLYYKDAIEPIDQDVINEINYYFHESTLPSSYFKTRNGMLNRDDSTRFSSFLSCGALDVRYLYNQVKDYEQRNGANKSTYWIIFELLWREFYYWHYQQHTKRYFSHNGLKSELDFSKYELIDLNQLKQEYGSNPFILAASRELEQTGFQSNRTRQIFASFIINCTHYHWRQGASLFEEYLIDYDVYSNWGNWMYLAGVGVDPRGSRFFHIPKQLKNYDPKLEYIKFWCPELKSLNIEEIIKRCHQE